MQGLGRDINALLKYKKALAQTDITAGGGADAVEITGTTIDLNALTERPESVSFAIPCEATLSADETLIVTGKIETSPDNSTWTVTVASATLGTISATGSDVFKMGTHVTDQNVRYVRCKVTPTMSHYETDTAKIDAVAVFGGHDVAPTT